MTILPGPQPAAGPPPTNGVGWIMCPWCTGRHTVTFLCGPAADVLALAHSRSAAGQAETPAGLTAAAMLTGDQAVRALTVNAAVTEVAGRKYPTLVITGTNTQGHTLPKWVYVADDEDMRRAGDLIAARIVLAVDTAQAANEAGTT